MKKLKTSADFLSDAKIKFSKYKKDFIFIRIPKNASTSIVHATGPTKHYSVKFLEDDVGVDLGKYFKFCIIRNPFDRLVSWFFYHKNVVNLSNRISNERLINHYKNIDFKQWIAGGCQLPDSWVQESDKYNPNPLHQHLWVCDADENLRVDYAGRYENLKDDYNKISKIIKNNKKLIKLNSSKHKSYEQYYDNETINIVNEIFEKDLNLFKYSYGEKIDESPLKG